MERGDEPAISLEPMQGSFTAALASAAREMKE